MRKRRKRRRKWTMRMLSSSLGIESRQIEVAPQYHHQRGCARVPRRSYIGNPHRTRENHLT
jgi:hypothetical protein